MNELQNDKNDKNDTIVITPSLVSEMQSSIKWGRWVSALLRFGGSAGGILCGFTLHMATFHPSSPVEIQAGVYQLSLWILMCVLSLLLMLAGLLRDYYENLDCFLDSGKMKYYHEALENLAQFWDWAIWAGVCWLLMALLMAFVFANY